MRILYLRLERKKSGGSESIEQPLFGTPKKFFISPLTTGTNCAIVLMH